MKFNNQQLIQLKKIHEIIEVKSQDEYMFNSEALIEMFKVCGNNKIETVLELYKQKFIESDKLSAYVVEKDLDSEAQMKIDDFLRTSKLISIKNLKELFYDDFNYIQSMFDMWRDSISGYENREDIDITFQNVISYVEKLYSYFIKHYGMDEFLKTFIRTNSQIDFLSEVEEHLSPFIEIQDPLCEDYSLGELVLRYIVENNLIFDFLLKDFQLNLCPILDLNLTKLDYAKLCKNDSNLGQILISCAEPTNNFLEYTKQHNSENILLKGRKCFIESSKDFKFLHICFYAEDYDILYKSLVMNQNDMNIRYGWFYDWENFIHVKDDELIPEYEDCPDISYPTFYQCLLENPLKFKKIITPIIDINIGIDDYAFTDGESHKNWLGKFPFLDENLVKIFLDKNKIK